MIENYNSGKPRARGGEGTVLLIGLLQSLGRTLDERGYQYEAGIVPIESGRYLLERRSLIKQGLLTDFEARSVDELASSVFRGRIRI